MRTLPIVGALALFALSTAAIAQYNGPSDPAAKVLPVLRTVSEVLRAPVDDQPVQLTGMLVRRLDRDTFQFRDASGEIKVEIDPEDFPVGQPVGPETHVTILGEVDTRVLRAPEIEGERLVIAPDPTPGPAAPASP